MDVRYTTQLEDMVENNGFLGFGGESYNPKTVKEMHHTSIYSGFRDILFTFTMVTSCIVLICLFIGIVYAMYKIISNNFCTQPSSSENTNHNS